MASCPYPFFDFLNDVIPIYMTDDFVGHHVYLRDSHSARDLHEHGCSMIVLLVGP